jgi:Kef-type K+ transport system membrane component KefB
MKSAELTAHPFRLGTLLGYAGMILACVLTFLLIRHFGERLSAPIAEVVAASSARAANPTASHALFHVLLAMTAVITVGSLLGRVCRKFGQPPVIGEILAGIALGPSLLGQIYPAASHYLLPDATAPLLSVIAQLGVILYMFLVGLELDAARLRSRGEATLAISHASIVAPFVLGSLLALWLYPRLSDDSVSFTGFALFLGVAMSITAFPVLARILSDRGLNRTPLGVVALACAATDDVTAWCLLAFVVGVVDSGSAQAVGVICWTLVYIAFMFFAVRPILARRLRQNQSHTPRELLATMFVLLLVSALITEWIGVHAIFGAFLLGAIIPHDSRLAEDFRQKLEDVVTVLLLPAFFAVTGLRTQIGLVSGWENWLFTGVIILVATAGKFGGACLAGRLTGLPWRESMALGALMNTRGLMELIVLNVGLDLGVISPRLYAMMVLMALATTVATTPLLARIWPAQEASPHAAG